MSAKIVGGQDTRATASLINMKPLTFAEVLSESRSVGIEIVRLQKALQQCRDFNRWTILMQLYYARRHLSDMALQQDYILDRWTNSFDIRRKNNGL